MTMVSKTPMRIALSGRMGSGKTHFAERLLEEYGGTRLSFAAPIKDLYNRYSAKRMLGDDPLEKRHFCQAVGEGLREFDEDFWAAYLVFNLPSEGSVWVDDVRYPNEVRALEAEGFKVIRIVSPEEIRLSRLPKNTRAVDTVSGSETALDRYKFTYVFYNYYDETTAEKFLQFVKAVWRGD